MFKNITTSSNVYNIGLAMTEDNPQFNQWYEQDTEVDHLLRDAAANDEEQRSELSLRPQFLREYIGQEALKEELNVYISAAKQREEALDHVLLFGPPGLGKTTLAMIIANEMNVNIKTTSGPAIEKPGDLVALLNELEPGISCLLMKYIEFLLILRK